MLLRLNTPGIPAREFHRILLEEIRNEYNHNVSQQIYMSEDVWNLVKNAKEDLIIQINEASQAMSPEASSLDLAKKIFELAMDKKIDPMGHALSEVKKEIQQTF
jgi:predicted AlkP superfamily phosphohydrolase/phosphomutase